MSTTTYDNRLDTKDCEMTLANENENMDGKDCIMTDAKENENMDGKDDCIMTDAIENENVDVDVKDCEMADANENNIGMDWESSTVTTRSIRKRTFQESSFHDTLHDSPRSRSRSKVYHRLDSSVRRCMWGKKHQPSHHDTIMTPIPQKRTYHESFTLVPAFTMDEEDDSPRSRSKRNRLNSFGTLIDRPILCHLDDVCKSIGAIALR